MTVTNTVVSVPTRELRARIHREISSATATTVHRLDRPLNEIPGYAPGHPISEVWIHPRTGRPTLAYEWLDDDGESHRLTGPARLWIDREFEELDHVYEWIHHGINATPEQRVLLNAAWAYPRISDRQANALVDEATQRGCAPWVTHVLLSRTSARLTDSWRVLHAATA
jgi:hypothetical protein